MYHIEIKGDGETTHKTDDIKKVRNFIIDSVKRAKDLANFSVKVTEQA